MNVYNELVSGMKFKYVGFRGFHLKPGDVIILKDISPLGLPLFIFTRESDGLELSYVEDSANGYRFNEDFTPTK